MTCYESIESHRTLLRALARISLRQDALAAPPVIFVDTSGPSTATGNSVRISLQIASGRNKTSDST